LGVTSAIFENEAEEVGLLNMQRGRKTYWLRGQSTRGFGVFTTIESVGL
jgi:hypothetical protein